MLLPLLLLAQVANPTQLKDAVVAAPPTIASDAGAPVLQVTLSNMTSQPITAWQVNVRLTLSNGAVVGRGQSKDGYELYALHKPNDVVINPEGSVTGQIWLANELGTDGKLTVTDVQTTVAYVIFADGTALGDEGGIKEAFQDRALEADALAGIVAALRAGHAQGSGRAALRAALQELNSPEQTDFDNMSKRVMRKNLQRILDSPVQAGETAPDEYLRQWLLATEAKWQAADTHRRQKSNRSAERSPQ